MWKWLFLIWFFADFLTYVVHHIIVAIYYKSQNLKKRYNAQWALVTGASSGIGKALAFKLAKQGLNVVLVAFPDETLNNTFEEIQTVFPALQFRKVGADLGRPGYMDAIVKSTHDITVQIVFNNAGYLLTGFFHTRTFDELSANLHCNAICAVEITHHFLRKMIQKNVTGCFAYTSSAAALMPSPFSVQYAATKSFLSAFGASLAAEVKAKGIDVLVFHPSPVASRFYDKAHKIDVMEIFKRYSVPPEALPDTVFASIGRTVLRDIGAIAIIFRVLMKIMDYNFLAWLVSVTAHTMGDYKRHSNEAMKEK